MKILFFTGARSEYGIIRKLLGSISKDPYFDVSLIVGGIHMLEEYGCSIKEIEEDGFFIEKTFSFFEEGVPPSFYHFTKAINQISDFLNSSSYEAIFIVGDRFEAYAAALAAHLTNIPIVHFAGGTITAGAVDNIYRYNITNLSSIHLATSKGNFQRLTQLPIIEKTKVFFTGSIAIDSIKAFIANPVVDIAKFIPCIVKNQYVLITFHPATLTVEPIAEILEKSVYYILEAGCQILITYPNNDPGADEILGSIKRVSSLDDVFVIPSLGAMGYYAALKDCVFVLGNSSSGIIEAPYFNKIVVNVGERQGGREKDGCVFDVNASFEEVKNFIRQIFKGEILSPKSSSIYGDGQSIRKVIQILKKEF